MSLTTAAANAKNGVHPGIRDAGHQHLPRLEEIARLEDPNSSAGDTGRSPDPMELTADEEPIRRTPLPAARCR